MKKQSIKQKQSHKQNLSKGDIECSVLHVVVKFTTLAAGKF